ncbi:MAG: plasmid pRiA4b ORF-3 family protein [Paludibacteraceae bacterium]|nr:plasmid pRiA4b ORF-3 family protein [Paludibacteraceae bacterium]
MIYKITFSCEEEVGFRRVFEMDSDATFLDLHKAILESVNYPDNQMTSFFLCNENWEKGQEVTLVEMGANFEYDNMVMEETRLSDLLEEQGQRLIYIFDPMFERYFFGSLKEIKPGSMVGVQCVEKKGTAPKQLQTEDMSAIVGKDGKGDLGLDEDFYGDSQYDEGDLDMEGFQDLSFEDGSMF